MKPIEGFSGKFSFLSNFHPAPVFFEGQVWPTAEHAYQACKSYDQLDKRAVLACPTPGQAKRRGKRVTLQPNWEERKLWYMLQILRFKFLPEHLRNALYGTGVTPLIETNKWGDRYWGVFAGEGENWLGTLLMQVRSEAVNQLAFERQMIK